MTWWKFELRECYLHNGKYSWWKWEMDDLFNSMVQSIHEQSSNTSNTFDTMFDDAMQPLYTGCKKFTKLLALTRLYDLKVRYGWSNTSLSKLLSIISDLLPENNEIPSFLYVAKKTVGALELSYQKLLHVLMIVVYIKKSMKTWQSALSVVCRGGRSLRTQKNEKSEIVAKQIWYFPIVPRL